MDTMTKERVTVPFNESEIQYFTEYNCWALAIAMNRMFGFPIAFKAATTSNDGSINDDTLWSWSHVFNVLPDGSYIDIEGVHKDDKFLDKYPILYSLMLEDDEDWGYVGVIIPDHDDSIAMINPTEHNTSYVESIAYRVVGNYLLGK